MFSRTQIKVIEFVRNPHLELFNACGGTGSGKTVSTTKGYLSCILDPTYWKKDFGIFGVSRNTIQRNILGVGAEHGLEWMLEGLGLTLNMGGFNQHGLVKIPITRDFTARIWCFGAENMASISKMTGVSLGAVLLDEVPMFPEEVMAKIWTRIRGGKTKIFATMNPQSSNHYYKKKYIDNPNIRSVYVHYNPEKDNPGLSEDDKRRMKSGLSGFYYERDWLGKWVNAAGLIWPNFTTIDTDYDDFESFKCGFDYAASGVQATVLIGTRKNGQQVILDEHKYVARDLSHPASMEEITQRLTDWLWSDWQIKARGHIIYPDPATHIPMKRAMRQNGFQLIDGNNEDAGIIKMADLFTRKDVVIHSRCKNLLDEIGSYSWDPKAQERGEDKPLKSDDHFCDAVRYGVYRARPPLMISRI